MAQIQKWLTSRDRCDLCNRSIKAGDVPFFYDTRLRGSTTWALTCPKCFELWGWPNLGFGFAQKYDGATAELVEGGRNRDENESD